ncbi:DNA-binding transcriptional LysR family regulator [Sphingomonas kyeonggiensis]|uniref:DNA-binding transcriptional LysR family regulator n=1 Tax=Sphingomonas kyeonggiensis TaxID=1268553 RepID=A0A7W7K563_9SPHN|nr:LysR family transcriptional regulator [Sphingomonas kyeonggiensis]MBB4841286.1 DNA-binding transcriptional LysR family regulator [Sphingomonas kyeonggiensis]
MPFDARILTGVGVLATVVEAGNFARAGEALGLSPSGVSRAVARLEARIGIRLFDRTPRAATLTEEGRRFYHQVTPLLAGIEEAAGEAAAAAATVTGKLRVSVDPWFARMVLAPNLKCFLNRHPALSLDLLVSNHREEMMVGVDVSIRFGPPDGASLIARKILETRVITCASPSYLERRGLPTTPHDLIDHELILFRDPQTGRPFAWEFGQGADAFEVDVHGRMTTDDPSVAVEACLAGQGIFQSLALGLAPWLQRGDLIEILAGWSHETYPLFAYHPSRHLPPAKVRAFLDFVAEVDRGGPWKTEPRE